MANLRGKKKRSPKRSLDELLIREGISPCLMGTSEVCERLGLDDSQTLIRLIPEFELGTHYIIIGGASTKRPTYAWDYLQLRNFFSIPLEQRPPVSEP